MKNGKLLHGVILGALLVGAAYGANSSFFGLIGPQSDGTGITPNHWTLTPAGLQVEIGDRPMGMATSPDGRFLAIVNCGQGLQSLALFDTFTRKVVQTIPYTAPEALYLGVVWSNDGKNLVNGVLKRLHPQGSHPGLSDEEDCTFRLHLVLVLARFFLRRLDAKVDTE